MTAADSIAEFEQIDEEDVGRVGRGWARMAARRDAMREAGLAPPGGFVVVRTAVDAFFAPLRDVIAARLAAVPLQDPAARKAAAASLRALIVAHPLPATLRDALVRVAPAAGWVAAHAWTEPLDWGADRRMLEAVVVAPAADVAAVESVLRHALAKLYGLNALDLRAAPALASDFDAALVSLQPLGLGEPRSAGTAYLCDPESGFEDVVTIYSTLGSVVRAAGAADVYRVSKLALRHRRPAVIERTLACRERAGGASGRILDDSAVESLARACLALGDPLAREVCVQWLQRADGSATVLALGPAFVVARRTEVIERYVRSGDATALITGRAIAAAEPVATGRVMILDDCPTRPGGVDGRIVVTDTIDDTWEPAIRGAAALVTNRGGRTSTAVVLARSLDIPAVVGCGTATTELADGQEVTVSCAEGDTGFVYAGRVAFEVMRVRPDDRAAMPVRLLLHFTNPLLAFEFASVPHAGAAPFALDFTLRRTIGLHPDAVLAYPEVAAPTKDALEAAAVGYASPRGFYVDKLAEAVATAATAFWPLPVVVRLSDLSSRTWRETVGGEAFEAQEVNPSLGRRGASRHADERGAAAFALECEALRRVHAEMGFTNLELLVPHARSVAEAGRVLQRLATYGLARGERGLRIHIACDLPINAMDAHSFLDLFDGMWIDGDALYRLLIGVDEAADEPGPAWPPEHDAAFRRLVGAAVAACRAAGRFAGYCADGQLDPAARGRSVARWLAEIGVDAVAVSPDAARDAWLSFAALGPEEVSHG